MRYLQNEHIILRAPEIKDIEHVYRWENDSSLWFLGNSIEPISHYTVKNYIERCTQTTIAESRQLKLIVEYNQKVTGCLDLYEIDFLNKKAEIGILIDPEYQKQHIATQAINLVSEYAFKFLDLQQIYAYIAENNTASIQLFEKLNFQKSGTLRHWIKKDGEFINVSIYQKLRPNQL